MSSFFTHLVDVLGAEDFLSPICMLLIEKIANRVVRQPSEVQNSLVLPFSILEHTSSALQIRVRISPFIVILIFNQSFCRPLLEYCMSVSGLPRVYLIPKSSSQPFWKPSCNISALRS
jgi:hypothetical protein